MIGRHISDRFFQRYGRELTAADLHELVVAAGKAAGSKQDYVYPNRRHVEFYWKGIEVRLVWDPARRFIFTFLPQRVRTAWCLPKRRKGRR